MEIKITFDITPKLADVIERVCNDGWLVHKFCDCCHPEAYNEDRFGPKLDAPENAPYLPMETHKTSPVPKHDESQKSEPEAKIEAASVAIDEVTVEAQKPKRSPRKKAETPAEPETQTQAQPEKPAEPAESPTETETTAETGMAAEMTIDEIRAVCVKAATAGKTKVVTDFLATHDAQSISKLDPKHYVELAKIVEAAL